MPVSPVVPATWAVAAVIASSETAANEYRLLRDRRAWSVVTFLLLVGSGCSHRGTRQPDDVPDQRHRLRPRREAMRVGRDRPTATAPTGAAGPRAAATAASA